MTEIKIRSLILITWFGLLGTLLLSCNQRETETSKRPPESSPMRVESSNPLPKCTIEDVDQFYALKLALMVAQSTNHADRKIEASQLCLKSRSFMVEIVKNGGCQLDCERIDYGSSEQFFCPQSHGEVLPFETLLETCDSRSDLI